MKKIISLIFGFAMLSMITGCGKTNEIESIKKGTLNGCKEYTIEELVNNFFEEPKWTTEKSDKGYNVYNVTGRASYQGKKSDILIQFALDNNNIIIRSFEVNKLPEDKFVYNSLVTSMCDYSKSLENKNDKKEDEEEESYDVLVHKGATQNVYSIRTIAIENGKDNLKYRIYGTPNIEVKVSFKEGYNKNLDPKDIELYIDMSKYDGPGQTSEKVQVRQKDSNLTYEVNDTVSVLIDINN